MQALTPPIARRRAITFVVTTFALSGLIQARIAVLGGPISDHVPEIFALMWTPTVVSIGCRLAFREGLTDVSFRVGRRGGAWPWLVAWLLPVAVGLCAYVPAWLTGLETFAAPADNFTLGDLGPIPRFLAAIVLMLLLGTALSALTAAGEELGWRGYLLTRLIDAEIPRPVFWSGVIWGLWHVPLILTGQYAAGPMPLLSAPLFVIGVIAGGYVVALVRLQSGSVWAAVLFHASWNAIIQGPFDGFTAGGDASRTSSIWLGESGILVVLVHVIFALLLVRRGVTVRRAPSEPGTPLRAP